MKILIVGCGKLGMLLAEKLIEENHHVTIIDRDEAVLDKCNETLDAGQSFLFRVTSMNGVDLMIAINGNDSEIISDLLVGIFCMPTTLVDNLITGE